MFPCREKAENSLFQAEGNGGHPKRQAKAMTINLGHPDILLYPDSENGLAHGLFGNDSFRFDDVDPTTEESIEEQRWGADEGLFNPIAFPEAPAILFLRSDLLFRSDLFCALPCKHENKIGSKNKIGS